MVEYDKEVKQIEEEAKVNYISTPVQLGIEKGIQQGLHEGIFRGIHEGEAALLLRQIKHRFGHVPEVYLQRIQQADAETLLIWGERVLDASTLEEIFNTND